MARVQDAASIPAAPAAAITAIDAAIRQVERSLASGAKVIPLGRRRAVLAAPASFVSR